MPEIETVRLRLKKFTLDEPEHMFLILSDPDVMRYMRTGKPESRKQTKARLDFITKHWEQQGFGVWAAIHKEHQKLIGFCGLQLLDNTLEVELAYLLAKPYWGMGLATEAVKASLKYGFEELELDRIVAVARPENVVSQRVMEKVGLKYEKNAHYYNSDAVYYALSCVDYQPDDSLYLLKKD